MLACGVDLVRVERIELTVQRFGDRFLERVFTPAELQHCRNNIASLAARWAAKEAVSKALGTGIGAVRWQEIEIVSDASGAPMLRLHGAAADLAAARQLREWSVSLSHEEGQALAFVVAMG